MKTISIFGGAGFIGSHLCKFYLSKNFNVKCVDNFSTSKKNNIIKLKNFKNFELITHDIIKKIDIVSDIYINLASPASPFQYQVDPVKTFKTNIIGSINVLDLAKKYKSKVFQASTSEIYGDPLQHPQSETYFGNTNPIGLRSCYDESKRAAETLFIDYNRMYKTKIKIARIFNTYGPNMLKNDGRVISNFINQAIRNKNITIYGDGSQTRSFCFIDDLVLGIDKLIMSKNTITGPINLGNDQELKIIDLANLIIKLTNSDSKIIFKKLPSDDPLKRKPDIRKAKKILNWKPKTNLNLGIKRTINYFQKLNEA